MTLRGSDPGEAVGAAVRVRLETLGCRLNQSEIDTLARRLAALGHRLVGSAEPADLVVVNTCTVTAAAARKSRHLLRRLRRDNPEAVLVASGCFSEMEGAMARTCGADLVVPNAAKDRILEELLAADLLPPLEPLPRPSPAALPVVPNRRRTRAFIKVQDGCDNRCSYCVVPLARGPARSRTPDDILAEVERLAAAGCPEVVLTGVHLGSFGRDRGDREGLLRLVDAILERTALPRLRLSSIEPWDLAESLLSLFGSPRLLPHLHLPVQSGSDAVLRRMGRPITASRFSELVDAARRSIPDLAVSTDVMVGFPGETEEDFAHTTALLERLAFSRVHVFRFSPRSGTPASRFPDQVPARWAAERAATVQRLALRLEHRAMASLVGRTVDVLWESVDQGLVSGLTPNYLRVRARTPRTRDLRGVVTPTLLRGVADGALRGVPVTGPRPA